MTTLLVFSLVLVAAVLISELASRSILSTALLFLVCGFAAGNGWLSLVQTGADDESLRLFAELALFAVLFTDGMRLGARELFSAWRLSGRALLVGMPLTLLFTAALGHTFSGLAWPEAFLVGAVLAPTDPVFAAAIVGREEVPRRLRRLLNVESGLNDGLALPIVLVLLAFIGGRSVDATLLVGELALGVILGVVVPWTLIQIEGRGALKSYEVYQPLFGLSIALLVYALAHISGANVYLAAFTAGVTVSSTSEAVRDRFDRFGEAMTEVLKLGAIFFFGAAIQPSFFTELSLSDYLFAALVLFFARPAALAVSLAGSPLNRTERWAAAWFGPKGFASVVYSLLVLQGGMDHASHLFHLLSIVIVASMALHSSTDVWIGRWFTRARAAETGTRDLENEGSGRATT